MLTFKLFTLYYAINLFMEGKLLQIEEVRTSYLPDKPSVSKN